DHPQACVFEHPLVRAVAIEIIAVVGDAILAQGQKNNRDAAVVVLRMDLNCAAKKPIRARRNSHGLLSDRLQFDEFYFCALRREAVALRAVERSFHCDTDLAVRMRAQIDDSKHDAGRAVRVEEDQRRKSAQESALAGGKSHGIPGKKIKTCE